MITFYFVKVFYSLVRVIENFPMTIFYIGVFHESLKVSAFQFVQVPFSARAGNQTFNPDERDQLFPMVTSGMKKFQQCGLP